MTPTTPDASTGLSIAVTAPGSLLGARLVSLLEADADVEQVVAVSRPDDPDVKAALSEVDVLVELGSGTAVRAHDDLLGLGVAVGADTHTTKLLDAATGVGVDHVVALSSALVYGADAENPVPLTEAAAVRPVLSCPAAVACRSLEQAVQSATGALGPESRCTATILRTALVASEMGQHWFRSSPWSRVGERADESAPPLQFVHLDDLAAALALAAVQRPGGVFNVAADGWLSVDEVRALRAPRPRRLGRGRSPKGADAYRAGPWVVANDELRRAGWAPTWTNEECFVELDTPGPLGSLSARRRQELALGAVGVTIAGAAAGIAAVARARVRSR